LLVVLEKVRGFVGKRATTVVAAPVQPRHCKESTPAIQHEYRRRFRYRNHAGRPTREAPGRAPPEQRGYVMNGRAAGRPAAPTGARRRRAFALAPRPPSLNMRDDPVQLVEAVIPNHEPPAVLAVLDRDRRTELLR